MIAVWVLLVVGFFGLLVLALGLAATASHNDVELSELEAQARVRPSGGVSRMERER